MKQITKMYVALLAATLVALPTQIMAMEEEVGTVLGRPDEGFKEVLSKSQRKKLRNSLRATMSDENNKGTPFAVTPDDSVALESTIQEDQQKSLPEMVESNEPETHEAKSTPEIPAISSSDDNVKKTSPVQKLKNGFATVANGAKNLFNRKNSQQEEVVISAPTNFAHVNHNDVTVEAQGQPTTVMMNGQPVQVNTLKVSTPTDKQEEGTPKDDQKEDVVKLPVVDSSKSATRFGKGKMVTGGAVVIAALGGAIAMVGTDMPKSQINTRTWVKHELFTRLENGNYTSALNLVQEHKAFSYLSPHELRQVRRFIEAAIVAQKGLEIKIDENIAYQNRLELAAGGTTAVVGVVIANAIAQKRMMPKLRLAAKGMAIPAIVAIATGAYGFWEDAKRKAIPDNNQILLTMLDLIPTDVA
jgi:hypothetical protein